MKNKAKTMATKNNQTLTFLSVFTVLLIMCICGGCSSKDNPTPDTLFGNKPSRDCQQECNQLLQEKYYSVEEALSATRDFWSDFIDEEQCSECRDEVRKMENEFLNMDNLFSNIDRKDPEDRYCAFLSMVKSNDVTFSRSSFEAVRKTWEYLKEEKKDEYLNERLSLIDEDDFKPYLMDFAKQLAMSRYGKRKMVVVDSECYIINNQVKEISVVEGKCAKLGACTVHVEMKGNFLHLGWRTGYVEFSVEGVLGISESGCDVFFSKGNHEIKELGGALERIEKGLL